MRYYHRARPVVSFTLATAMLIFLALILSGILHISIDLRPVTENPQLVAVSLLFAAISALLLYEW
ncbi:MAG: hypothetical protein ACP5UQ_02210 [Anaerolineae bacterium]